MSEMINFELAFNGETHRFASILLDDELVDAVKDKVSSIVGKDDLQLYWIDDDSNILLESAADMSTAIDYAKWTRKDTSKPPCIYLLVGEEAAAVPQSAKALLKQIVSDIDNRLPSITDSPMLAEELSLLEFNSKRPSKRTRLQRCSVLTQIVEMIQCFVRDNAEEEWKQFLMLPMRDQAAKLLLNWLCGVEADGLLDSMDRAPWKLAALQVVAAVTEETSATMPELLRRFDSARCNRKEEMGDTRLNYNDASNDTFLKLATGIHNDGLMRLAPLMQVDSPWGNAAPADISTEQPQSRTADIQTTAAAASSTPATGKDAVDAVMVPSHVAPVEEKDEEEVIEEEENDEDDSDGGSSGDEESLPESSSDESEGEENLHCARTQVFTSMKRHNLLDKNSYEYWMLKNEELCYKERELEKREEEFERRVADFALNIEEFGEKMEELDGRITDIEVGDEKENLIKGMDKMEERLKKVEDKIDDMADFEFV